MSAPAVAVGRPCVRIRGTSYPVVLPTLRDPRLHLAAVIISLQVLGQVAFEFRLSIAQILVAVLTCGVLEVGIALSASAGDPVAGERAADGKRRRLHPARAGHGTRRLVEPPRRVDLRRRSSGRVAVEVRDPPPRPSPVQPLQLRSRRLLPRSSVPRARSRSTSGGRRCRPGWLWRSRSSSRAASRSSGGCACSKSQSGSGSRSPPASPCSPPAGTR